MTTIRWESTGEGATQPTRKTGEELSVLLEDGPVSVWATDWAGQRVLYVSLPSGMNLIPLLEDLPGDRYQCPHLGYMVKGLMRVVYSDHAEDTLRRGDLFYMPPVTRSSSMRTLNLLRQPSGPVSPTRLFGS